jgi:hypothetical protein
MSQQAEDTLKGVAFLAFLMLVFGSWGYAEFSQSRRAAALAGAKTIEELVSSYFPASAEGRTNTDGDIEVAFSINALLSDDPGNSEFEPKFLDVAREFIPLSFEKAPDAARIHITANRTYVLKTGKDATIPWRKMTFERSVSDGMVWPKVEAHNLPGLAKRYWRFPNS